MSEPYCACVEAFSTYEVVSLLQNVPEEGTTATPPAKSKAGEVYIYKYEQESKKRYADWYVYRIGGPNE